MKRTQVYLDYETHKMALTLASQTRQTLSSLIRTSLKNHVKSTPQMKNANPLVGLYRLGKRIKWPKNTPKDLSTNLDKYLYDPAHN